MNELQIILVISFTNLPNTHTISFEKCNKNIINSPQLQITSGDNFVITICNATMIIDIHSFPHSFKLN